MTAPTTPYVVVCFARSGTHFLESALNRHPDITCFWEPFNTFAFTPTSSAAEILHRIWTHGGIVGFTAHWEWQGRTEWVDLWDALLTVPELRVIQLHRENLLRQYVSKQLLDKTRTHAYLAGQPRPEVRPTLHIDVHDMLTYMFILETSIAAKHRSFEGLPSLHTTYERLTSAPQDELDRIQRFLGAEPLPLQPSTQKQETRSLREVVDNYDDVAHALTKSGWGHFLDE